MRLIAYRIYDNGTDEPCFDQLFRRGNSFALRMTGGEEPESWSIVTGAAAFEWLNGIEADETLTVVG